MYVNIRLKIMAEIVSLYDDLIRRCINKDERARKELYDLFAIPMYNLCLRFAKDKSEAEDIFQDAFIKVFENLNNLYDRNLLPGWIKRIFVHTAIDAIRAKKVELISIDRLYNLEIDSNDALDKLKEDDVLELIHKLPTKTRTIFIMYVIEGYSHKEIAQILGISEGTSKSQLFDAKLKLKNQINKLNIKELKISLKEV